MYLKRYTLGTLLLLLFTGWYVSQFLGYNQSEAISLFGIQLPALPIAALVLMPVVVLYIASVIHMLTYSVKNFFKLRNYQKDYDNLIDVIIDELLFKEKKHTFKTPRYELLGQVLENTSMMVKGDLSETSNERINAVLKILNELKSGKAVDLRKFNLNENNPLVLQNHQNRMRNLELTSEEILNKREKYPREILVKAFVNFSATAPMNAIEKYKEYLSKDALFIILARVNSKEKTLEVTNQYLMSLISKLDLNKSDYLSISKELSIHMIPEQRIQLFQELADKDEEAQDAYFFTLLDLEMIDKAKECLESVPRDDALKFRAYLALKESGYNFNINLFI